MNWLGGIPILDNHGNSCHGLPVHPLRRLTVAEQAAGHLRDDLRRGRWSGRLPGVARLAAELDISTHTVQAALRRLESEGILTGHGPGRSRSVNWNEAGRRVLRVGILRYEGVLADDLQTSGILLQIEHDLEAAGDAVFLTRKSQVELQHDVRRVARHIGANPADAWIVVAGSRPVLEWFASQPVPCLALYGRTGDLPLARTGPDKLPAMLEATRRLIALGHRRIVLINRSPRRKPTPGRAESAFLAELASHGIATGAYNLPDWEETPEGFSSLLERLFRSTPPTALIIDENPRFLAATQFLARRRIDVPGQVSLVATDYDFSLSWFHPPVAHMRWDSAPVVRRVVRWVAALRKGRADRKTINFPAEFVPGGTIGPVRNE